LFSYEGILGEQETVFAEPASDVSLRRDQVDVSTWRAPDGFHIALIASEEGTAMLSALADLASQTQIILVSVGDKQLGTFSPSLLKVSHGTLGFAFSKEHTFSQVLEALGVSQSTVGVASDSELLEACSGIADPAARKRCQRTTWSEVQREKDSLRRAEKLLESGSPDDRDAAIEELLKD
jgi:hypothetical protein